MAIDLRGVTAVLLPGTGSDDDYVARAFAAPLHAAGARLVAPPPEPGRLIEGYWVAMDAAAQDGPIAVGGVSIGAAVSLTWALRHPDRTVAVLAALPAWTGEPGERPGRAGGAVFRATATRPWPGRDDSPDAGVQPAVAGRGADPVVARPVA